MADLTWIPGVKRKSTTGPLGRQKLGESLKKKPKLPVTCGNKEGILHKDKFNKSEPCIFSDGQWFTPTEFEKHGGKEKNKKWKISIQHNQIQLQSLIQDGLLSSPSFKTKRSQDQEPKCRENLRRSSRSNRHSKNSHTSESVSSSDSSSESDHSDDDDDDDDDEEVTQRMCRLERESDHSDDDNDDNNNDDDDDEEEEVTERMFSGDSFDVTCSTGKGVLHVSRFAAETCGKCIRTQDAWLTPKDFLDQNKMDGNWRRDITSHGVPLGMLLMRRVLKPHMVNCRCPICKADPLHLLDQNNDDTCFKCKRDGDLVCCDKCPRAFHHQCHKPALMDDIIGENWTCSFCKKFVPAARKSS